ncbi:MAG: phosphocholine cytidylyltransferase family protein [Candidatus Woykebacteria bacterium]
MLEPTIKKTTNTSVVILAAGFGMRLKNNKPKALVELSTNKTILDYQVEKISKYIPVDNISVVVGYKKKLVEKAHPELKFVYNDAYDKTNTGKSLLAAVNTLKGGHLLWLNGDVVFDEMIVPKILATTASENSCVLVDNKRCGEEEVKYDLDRHGKIIQLSKTVKNPKGESLGINLLLHKDIPLFKRHLALIGDTDYFEKALENMISEGARLDPVYTNGLFCAEIDFPQDLEEVQNYLRTPKREPALVK